MAESIKRQELYDLVWSQPMSKLAVRFGMSDVALKKHCARAGIPTPDRGYWAKKESGKPTIQVALPRRPPGMSEEVFGSGGNYAHRSRTEEEVLASVPSAPEFSESIDSVKEWIVKEVGKISVPREIRVWHPAIERLLKEDDKRREEQRTKGYSWIKPLFESPFEQRRLKILNSVFFGTGKMSGRPRISKDARDISIGFHDSWVLIGLDRLKPSGRGGGQSQDDQNPRLCLGIRKDYSSDTAVTSWADDEDGRLERKLTQIVIEIILRSEIENRERAVRSYEWRVKWKAQIEEERKQRKIKAEREEKERQVRLEQARIDRLMSDAAAFKRAAEIRRYVESIRATISADLQTDMHRFEAWSQWALAQADRIDPSLERRYLNSMLDRPGEARIE